MICYRESFYSELFTFIILLCLCLTYGHNITVSISKDVVSDLYLKYKEAVTDKNDVSSRRLFKNNKDYEIHVKRLKEVNGFKVHNLMIKENVKTKSNPLIYINNPVESKIPRAYLSLEEFKTVLTERIMRERDAVFNGNKKNNLIQNPIIQLSSINNKISSTKFTDQTKIKSTTKEIHTKKLNSKTVVSRIPKTDSTYLRIGREYNYEIEKPIRVDYEKQLTVAVDNLTETKIEKTNEVNTERTEFDTTKDSTQFVSVERQNLSDIVTLQLVTKAENVTQEETSIKLNLTTDMQILKNNTDIFEDITIENTNLMKNEEIVSEESKATKKFGPRRKSTPKISKTTKTVLQRKRSTLGRPLVFMGN